MDPILAAFLGQGPRHFVKLGDMNASGQGKMKLAYVGVILLIVKGAPAR